MYNLKATQMNMQSSLIKELMFKGFDLSHNTERQKVKVQLTTEQQQDDSKKISFGWQESQQSRKVT